MFSWSFGVGSEAQCLACAMEMMCRMSRSGTAKVGMRLSGRRCHRGGGGGVRREFARVEEWGERAEGYGGDEVSDSEQMPGDERAPMGREWRADRRRMER